MRKIKNNKKKYKLVNNISFIFKSLKTININIWIGKCIKYKEYVKFPKFLNSDWVELFLIYLSKQTKNKIKPGQKINVLKFPKKATKINITERRKYIPWLNFILKK